ncbi:MAG: NirD/YgiW/YdeI family stress tolerance protein [Chlorobiales bacterium]|nr:NirD/YgiW/YdeI family stress tolerance protein [Chlorobiales bacterium]
MKRGFLRVSLAWRVLVILLVGNTGYAEYVWPEVESPRQVTVATAKHLKEDAKILLQGFITGHLRGEYYLFRDDSGEIGIEIESNMLDRKQIGPDTGVRIHGEVEHESGFVYIEVYRLEIYDYDSCRK